MFYPINVVTNGELSHRTITENVFYLDQVKSEYINIKCEIITEDVDGVIKDRKLNSLAIDGDK